MLSWVYYYLSLNPICRSKMIEEHNNVFGQDTDPVNVATKISSDPKLLAKLECTTAVMKEALRLRPIGDGVRVSPPGYIIRMGTGAEFDTTDTILDIQHNELHTKQEIWGTTAAAFDPERFMSGRNIPSAYMPFSKRPRDCIGQNLAYLEGYPEILYANYDRERLH